MKRTLFVLLVIGGIWYATYGQRAHWHGAAAPQDPIQMNCYEKPPPFKSGDYSIQPLAAFSVTAVVLSRHAYNDDRESDLSPVDLALGWGPLSDADVINKLKVDQYDRWYDYSWRGDPPIDPNLVPTHSGNTHCVPADDDVRQQLLAIHRFDLVTLEGYLVEIKGPDGFNWRSNLTNNSSGEHGCRVLWVRQVSHQKI